VRSAINWRLCAPGNSQKTAMPFRQAKLNDGYAVRLMEKLLMLSGKVASIPAFFEPGQNSDDASRFRLLYF